ncbi:MAG: phosphatidate cytidylyltransferase [Acholeplasmataceae bacterium]
MRKRLITGIVLAIILIPLIVFERMRAVFEVMMAVFVVISAIELIRMYEKKKKFGLLPSIGIVFSTLLMFFSLSGAFGWFDNNDDPPMVFNILRITIPLITLIIFSSLVFFKNFNGEDIGKALTIVNYVGIGYASLVSLRFLGVRFIVFLLIISSATDVFAYLFGVKFGKHKMAPMISPKKSWEGAIAGTVIATILASCFALFYGDLFPAGSTLNTTGVQTLLDGFSFLVDNRVLQVIFIIPITVFASIIGQLGDLFASKLKRTYEIKDFGTILPGHGGILDRFDSALFVAMFLTAVFVV